MGHCPYCNILVITDYFCSFGYVLDPMQWLPKQCLHICKPLRLSNCSSKGNTNILIQLNLSTATGNIYFPTSEYESGKCSDCHYIESIAINCNIDSLFDIKGKNTFYRNRIAVMNAINVTLKLVIGCS